MAEHVYKSIEITGSSRTSVEDAINGAIARARRRCTTSAGSR